MAVDPKTQALLDRIAKQAEDNAPLEERTVEEMQAGAGVPDPDEVPTVAIAADKMENLAIAYPILPPSSTIQNFRIYLKGIASSRVGELVDAIFRAWPTALFIASKVDLTPEGAFDIREVARYWSDVRIAAAESNLPEPTTEQERKAQQAALRTLIYSPLDVVRELNLLEEAPEGEPTPMEQCLPEIGATVWMLAGDCPQNAGWTQETLIAFLRENFRLPDYARLARLLLEVNSIGGGYTDDLCERFIVPL